MIVNPDVLAQFGAVTEARLAGSPERAIIEQLFEHVPFKSPPVVFSQDTGLARRLN